MNVCQIKIRPGPELRSGVLPALLVLLLSPGLVRSQFSLPADLAEVGMAVSGQDLHARGYSSLGEVLRQWAEVLVLDTGGLGQLKTPTLSGRVRGEVLVLIDGVPLSLPWGESLNLNELPLEVVEQVVILPGDLSALYGPGANGGVIWVTTQGPPPTQPVSRLTGVVGAFDDQIYRVWFATSLRARAALAVAGNRQTTDGLGLSLSRARTSQVWAGLTFRPHPDWEVKVSVLHPTADRNRGEPLPEPGQALDESASHLRMGWHGRLPGRTRWEGAFLWSTWQRTAGQGEERLTWEGDRKWARSLWRWGGEDQLFLGVDGGREETTFPDSFPQVARELGGAFLGATLHEDRWTLRVRGRLEGVEGFEGQVAVAGDLAYRLSPRLTVALVASRGLRLPPLRPGLVDGQGAPLTWEVSREGEAQLRYSAPGSERLLLKGWYRRTDQLFFLPTVGEDGPPFPLIVIPGPVRVWGGSVEGRTALGEGLTVRVSYLYQRGQFLDTGEALPYQPRQIAVGQVGWERPVVKSGNLRLGLGLWGRYEGRRATDLRTRPVLPAFFVLGGHLEARLLGFTATVLGENLLDTSYQTVAGFPMPGRSARVSIHWELLD